MEWRDRKIREVSEYIDKAYDAIREISKDGVRKGSTAGGREFRDALDLLNLSERMAKRGSTELSIWERKNGVADERNA